MIFPVSSTSIRSAAGTFGRPGIVMISPVRATINPAPAEILRLRTVTSKSVGAPSLRRVELLQENVQGNQQKSVSREQKMTLNMQNIWKREMQNTTDGIPQEERSRWKP